MQYIHVPDAASLSHDDFALDMKIIGSIIALTLAQCMLLEATPAYAFPRLSTRQSPDGFDQCTTPCSPIMNFVGAGQEGCTPQACCSTTFQQDYLDCFTCVGKARNETDYSLYQSQLDELTAACDAAGITVPKLTFPGQDPSRALPSLTSGSAGIMPASTTGTTTTNSSGGSVVQTTATKSLGGSTTSAVQTTITTLPTTTASNSEKKTVGNAKSHLGLLVISCITIQSFL